MIMAGQLVSVVLTSIIVYSAGQAMHHCGHRNNRQGLGEWLQHFIPVMQMSRCLHYSCSVVARGLLMMLKIKAEAEDDDNRSVHIRRHRHHFALLASSARGHRETQNTVQT